MCFEDGDALVLSEGRGKLFRFFPFLPLMIGRLSERLPGSIEPLLRVRICVGAVDVSGYPEVV